jgi:hypothetical protein
MPSPRRSPKNASTLLGKIKSDPVASKDKIMSPKVVQVAPCCVIVAGFMNALYIALIVALPGTAASMISLIVVIRISKDLRRHIATAKSETINHLTFRIAAAVKEGISRADELERRQVNGAM